MKPGAGRALELTDKKSLLALRDVGPESEAESARFRGRRVTSGPGSQTCASQAGGCEILVTDRKLLFQARR